MGREVEENPCQDYLSNSQHSLALLIAGVNEVLLKAGGITFSLALSDVLPGSCRDSAVTYTCIPVCGGGRFLGRAEAGTAANVSCPPNVSCRCVPLSSPMLLCAHKCQLSLMEPSFLGARHCASPLACPLL